MILEKSTKEKVRQGRQKKRLSVPNPDDDLIRFLLLFLWGTTAASNALKLKPWQVHGKSLMALQPVQARLPLRCALSGSFSNSQSAPIDLVPA
jgi:hypothetical protein